LFFFFFFLLFFSSSFFSGVCRACRLQNPSLRHEACPDEDNAAEGHHGHLFLKMKVVTSATFSSSFFFLLSFSHFILHRTKHGKTQ